MAETKNQPAKKYRAGSISLTAWKNDVPARDGREATSFLTFNIQRGYKNKEGQWANTDSLRKQDLPVVEMLVRRAFEDASLGSDEE